MFRFIGSALRQALEIQGFWIRRKSVLPFGIDYQLDIKRLCGMRDTEVLTFFDVGAHTGSTSLAALNNFDKAKVYAFEPQPETFAALNENIPRGVRFNAFNVALSDNEGKASFFEYGSLATSNSLVGDSQFAIETGMPFKTREVQCVTLDRFCDTHNLSWLDVLKIDTEGHDLAVIRGSERTLMNRGVKFVFSEFNTFHPKLGTSGGALCPISHILEPLGFQFVASYPEYMITDGSFFVTANALFVRVSANKLPD